MDEFVIKYNETSPATLEARAAAMTKLEQVCASQVQWYEFESPAQYRKMRSEGTNGFPKPQLWEGARNIQIQTRDGHSMELRIIDPLRTKNAVLLHFHAGGFVIGSSRSYDNYLVSMAKRLDLVAVSVDYRLAPEFVYPTHQQDCVDAALFALSKEGEFQLGGRLRVLMGESAGGALTIGTALRLRDEHDIDVRSKIDVLLASYGPYDLTYTPSVLRHTREVIMGKYSYMKFMETSLGHIPLVERKDPKISPLYADLSRMPPALFMTGTEDPLSDDSVFMAYKWRQAGNVVRLVLVPGAWHAFNLIPAGAVTEEGNNDIVDFARQHL